MAQALTIDTMRQRPSLSGFDFNRVCKNLGHAAERLNDIGMTPLYFGTGRWERNHG